MDVALQDQRQGGSTNDDPNHHTQQQRTRPNLPEDLPRQPSADQEQGHNQRLPGKAEDPLPKHVESRQPGVNDCGGDEANDKKGDTDPFFRFTENSCDQSAGGDP